VRSGFTPGDSTVNQLTYFYNTFCKALDDRLEVRTVFFDISKGFEKVWHDGFLYKLKNAILKGILLNWLSDYLSNRRQCVVLPGQSNWSTVNEFHKDLLLDLCCSWYTLLILLTI
jgi:hypothetical protein